MGWTGGQYSVFRIALGAAVAHVCFSRLDLVDGPGWPLLLLGVPGGVALAFGWRDRALTGLLLVLVAGLAAFVDGAPLVLPAADVALTSSLLVLHLCVPVAPYGSWIARGRIDPRGGWSRPAWVGHGAWIWLAFVHLALARWGPTARSPSELDFGALAHVSTALEIGLVVSLFAVAWRPAAWIAITLWQLGWSTAFGPLPGDGALLLLHVFAADPAWWPGRRLHPLDGEAHAPAVLFYDGDCGFCHRSVRFVLSEEAGTPELLRMRFAPLGSDRFARLVGGRDDVDPEALPDSIVLVQEDGRLLLRSAAALEIASRLGGLWRLMALVGGVLPTSLLDPIYDAVARVRKMLFAKPGDTCPILPPELRARFDS